MEAKIIGLTESTITFTEVEMASGNKLILHGKEEAIVNLSNASKLNEIAVLEGCKLIKCVELDKEETKKDEKEDEDSKEETEKDEKEQDKDEDIEDAPKKKKRGRGRPKGAKNKPSKSVKRIESSGKEIPKDKAIVVNANGDPVEACSIKEDDKAPEESEATRASLEAMKEIEEEEAKAKEEEKKNVDEESMEANNQMGRTATVYTGEGTAKVEMKNNFIPESEVAKNADPFIDPKGSDNKAGSETEAFLDDIGKDDEDDNGISDAFIEM